ncbi:MAG: hypothetical protein AB1664_05620 [Thermodesulfobacteriota bacterium]
MGSARVDPIVVLAVAAVVGMLFFFLAVQDGSAAARSGKQQPAGQVVTPTSPSTPTSGGTSGGQRSLNRPAAIDFSCTGNCSSSKSACYGQCGPGSDPLCGPRCDRLYNHCMYQCRNMQRIR